MITIWSSQSIQRTEWTTPQPDWLHSSEEALPIRGVRKRFRSGVTSARTRSFSEADTGSDHDLLMITFHLRLKRISKPKHTRLKFDLEKLKDPNMLETFQTMIGRKFAPLTIMTNEYTDLDSMITTFSTKQWLKQPVRSLANPGSLKKFLICTTKGENWERKYLNLKDSRNTGEWTITSRGAWKRQKKTGQENSVERLKKTWGRTTVRGHTNWWKTWPLWNEGKLLLSKIVQENGSQKNDRTDRTE